MPTKVLIADDEPDLELLIRQRFHKQIRQKIYEFTFAQNGEEALEKLQEDTEIGVVMTDLNMPVMDGLTLLSRIGSLSRTIKVVIVSAYGDMQNIRTAMNRGAYDFLTKPIDFEDFEATMQKTIQEVTLLEEAQRDLRRPNLLFAQGDATMLPLQANRFDHVFMLGGIHHVLAPALNRVLPRQDAPVHPAVVRGGRVRRCAGAVIHRVRR